MFSRLQYICFTVNLNFYDIFIIFLKCFHFSDNLLCVFFEKRRTLGLYSILFVRLFLKMSIALCSLCSYLLEHWTSPWLWACDRSKKRQQCDYRLVISFPIECIVSDKAFPWQQLAVSGSEFVDIWVESRAGGLVLMSCPVTWSCFEGLQCNSSCFLWLYYHYEHLTGTSKYSCMDGVHLHCVRSNT